MSKEFPVLKTRWYIDEGLSPPKKPQFVIIQSKYCYLLLLKAQVKSYNQK